MMNKETVVRPFVAFVVPLLAAVVLSLSCEQTAISGRAASRTTTTSWT